MTEHRLDLKLGFACNNHCLFCAQGEKRGDCDARPVEDLVQELARARPKATGVVLTGGEPTLYKPLRMLVKAARRLGYSNVQLQTNGRALSSPRLLGALVQAGLTEVSPSLHGATAETHDALTLAPGSFAQSTLGMKNAVDAGLPVVTNTVVTQKNLGELAAIVSLLADLGVRHAQLAFVHPVGTAWDEFDQIVPRLSDTVAPIRAARDVARERGVELVTEAVPLCFLPDMQELAVEWRIPDTTVADLGGRLDYSDWRVREGKAHGPPCETCSARGRCEGPWREYPERRGWDEFVPIP
jgi:MoaA/NifB/PqqE/SkfB family radical SAM enzyme